MGACRAHVASCCLVLALGLAGICSAREPSDPDNRPDYVLSVDGDETLTLACGLTVPKIKDARGVPHAGVGLRRSHPCEENRSDALDLWRADQFVAAWRDPGTNVVTLLRLAYPFPYALQPGQLLPANTYLRDARALTSVGYPTVTPEHVQDWLNHYYQRGSTGAAPFQAVSTLARLDALEAGTQYDVKENGKTLRVYVFKLRDVGKTPLTAENWYALELRSERELGTEHDAFAEEFLKGLAVDPAALAAERAYWDKEPFDAFSRANAVRGVRNLADEWRAFDHGHFCLLTDHPAAFELAKEGLEAQQRAYDLFKTVLFPFGPASEAAVCVIRVYATAWEFEDSVPRTRKWAGGMYVPGCDEIVMRGWSREGTVHECTHRYLHSACGQQGLSAWFNEGFACYFGGCQVSEGRLVPAPVDSGHLLLAMIKQGELRTVADVFTVEDFYLDKEMESHPRDPVAALKRAKNYTSAWGVIYFLREAPALYPGKGYEALIPLYWETLQRTGKPEAATDAVLQKLAMPSFLVDLGAYFLTFEDAYNNREKGRHLTEPKCDCEYCEFLRRTRQPYPAEFALGNGGSAEEEAGWGRASTKRSAASDTSATVRPGPKARGDRTEGSKSPQAKRRTDWAAGATVALALTVVLACGWRLLRNGKLFALALLLSAGQLSAEVAETNTYTVVYRVVGDAAVLGDGTVCAITPKPKGEFIIPPTLAGHPVAGIGAYAFAECEELTALTLPKTVTSIGGCAFYSCQKLKAVSLPEAVEELGVGAFFLCSSLEAATIPPRVTVVPDWAFGRCFRLSEVQFGKSVRVIGNDAFLGCAALSAVAVPKSVTAVGDRAFKWCYGLQTAVVEGPVTALGSEVFAGCSALSDVALPKSVTVIGEGAFRWCSALRQVEFPESVTVLGSQAFYGCHRLASIDIPDAVAEIGSAAFSGCLSLDSVDLGTGVTVIGSHAFYECYALSSITFPASLTDLHDSAFARCSALFSVTLPPSLTALETQVFRECTGLASVTLPPSVTVIGEAAFETCVNLSAVNLPDSVTAVGAAAFAGCVGMRKVTFGKAVAKIGKGAFSSCESLQEVEIPASVTSIGGKAFEKCSRLSAVHFAGNAPSSGSDIYAFTPDTLTSYAIPGTQGWKTRLPGEWRDRPFRYHAPRAAASSR